MTRSPDITAGKVIWAMAAIFFLSGATALVYQVVWMRQLSLFFGSDVYAAAITLSVFMGGLSLGSLFASRIGDRLSRPMIAYGWLEIGIALYAVLFPVLLFGLEDAYRTVYRGYFADLPLLYQVFRVGVSAIALLPPTVMMGATLPLFIRQFARSEGELGQRVGFSMPSTLSGRWPAPWSRVSFCFRRSVSDEPPSAR